MMRGPFAIFYTCLHFLVFCNDDDDDDADEDDDADDDGDFSPGNNFSVVDSKNKPLGVTGRRVAFVLLQ